MNNQVKIIITDDKEGYRKMFRTNLHKYGVVTLAEAENGIALLKLLKDLTPDVILLDLEMPVMNGSITMGYLQELYPETNVVVLSAFNEYELKKDYLNRGAKAYLSKDDAVNDFEQFAKILLKIRNGSRLLIKNEEDQKLDLTEVQKDITHLAGNGKTNKEISEHLGITADGVVKQEKKIMSKMGVDTIVEFYNYVTATGLKFLRDPRKHRKKD